MFEKKKEEEKESSPIFPIQELSSFLPKPEEKKEERVKWDESVQKFTDKLELIGSLSESHHPAKDILTQDFILASFDSKEKEFVTEQLRNADFARKILLRFQNTHRYKWNKDKEDWERNEDGSLKKCNLLKEDLERIKKSADSLMRTYMLHIYTITTLARNKSDNFLLKLLGTAGEVSPKELEEKFPEHKPGFWKNVGNFFSGKGVDVR